MQFQKFAVSISIFIFLSCAGLARADCTDPSGGVGQIKYNSAQSLMQYCNGADWVGFPKTTSGCSAIAPWTPVTRDTDHEWVTGTYGHAGFVIRSWAGPNRTMISPDGYNWTVVPGDTESYSMTYGNGLYVGVDYTGPMHIQTSPDAVNWTQHAAPEDNAWQHVTFGGGLFVAVAQDGAQRIMTSGNGASWALHDAGTDVEYRGVTYGDGKYVAVGHGNRVAYSEDGANWVQHSIPYSTWGSVAYGNGRFVAVSIWNSPHMAVSTDGINWTAHNPPSTANGWSKVVFAHGVFVAVASQGPDDRTMYSTDGLNWTPIPAVQDCAWSELVYGNDRFVALCRNGDADRIMVAECGGTSCTNPDRPAGALAFNADHRVLQWCDGNSWQAAGPVDPGGADIGCTAPDRPKGTIAFNADHCILQYCDGETWRGIGAANACSCHLPGLRSGLLGHWKFDEDGGSVASDSSVHGNHGALTGSTAWTSAGHLSSAIELNGSSGGVNAGSESIIDNLGPFSIAAWIYPRGYGEGYHGRIAGKAAGTNLPSNGWRLATTNDMTRALSFSVHYNSSHLEYVTGTNAYAFNAWNFVVVTWDGTTGAGAAHIYVNGIETGYSYIDAGSGTRQSDAAQNLYIGGNAADNRTFDGYIDSVRLYDRVISGDEISALYADTLNCD